MIFVILDYPPKNEYKTADNMLSAKLEAIIRAMQACAL